MFSPISPLYFSVQQIPYHLENATRSINSYTTVHFLSITQTTDSYEIMGNFSQWAILVTHIFFIVFWETIVYYGLVSNSQSGLPTWAPACIGKFSLEACTICLHFLSQLALLQLSRNEGHTAVPCQVSFPRELFLPVKNLLKYECWEHKKG